MKSYNAPGIKLDIETKVEAGAPHETALREQFVSVVLDTIRAAGLLDSVTIQSFDRGSLMLTRHLAPRVPVVALTNGDFLQVGRDGASPWLGGLDIDDSGGDGIAAVATFGTSAYSPVQGTPQGGKVGEPGFSLYPSVSMESSPITPIVSRRPDRARYATTCACGREVASTRPEAGTRTGTTADVRRGLRVASWTGTCSGDRR